MECEQCGRVGTRGFKQLGPWPGDPRMTGVPVMIICEARKSCLRRAYQRVPIANRHREDY